MKIILSLFIISCEVVHISPAFGEIDYSSYQAIHNNIKEIPELKEHYDKYMEDGMISDGEDMKLFRKYKELKRELVKREIN